MNDLSYIQGQDNSPGLIDTLWLVEQEAVTTPLPTMAATYGSITNGEDTTNLSLTGNIALGMSRKFGRLYVTDGSGRVEMSIIGSRDSKSVQVNIIVRYPRLDRVSLNMLRRLKNGPLVLLYRQRSDSKVYACGFQAVEGSNTIIVGPPVYLEEATANTGAAPEDENGITFTFRWNANHPPVEYAGTIDTTA